MGLKVLFRTLLIFALALFGGRPLQAGCVDQESTEWRSTMSIVAHLPVGQSFVPSESEHLGLDLRFESTTDFTNMPVTVLLHEDDLDGPIVTGSTVTVVPPPGYWHDWIPFAFEFPVFLTPGSTYVIEVITGPDTSLGAGDYISWAGDHNDSYAGGYAYWEGLPWVGDYNFHTWVACDESLDVSLNCSPASGTLPFSVHMDVYLKNLFGGQVRQYAARIDVALASGAVFSNWRAGYLNLHAGWYFTREWNQNLPMLVSLQGENVFTLIAEDVTPAPYNLPPYLPSGDTDTASCLVTGIAP